MTKVMNGIHVLSYDEWKKQPEVADRLLDVEDCDTCDGDGDHECDCGDMHTCGECFGSGKKTDFRFEYESLLKDELEKLISWKNGDPIRNPTSSEGYKSHSSDPLIILSIQGGK